MAENVIIGIVICVVVLIIMLIFKIRDLQDTLVFKDDLFQNLREQRETLRTNMRELNYKYNTLVKDTGRTVQRIIPTTYHVVDVEIGEPKSK